MTWGETMLRAEPRRLAYASPTIDIERLLKHMSVARGYDREIEHEVIEGARAKVAELRSGGMRLTPRQTETLRMLLFGASEKQVALKLSLSRHTVHEHVKAIYRTVGVSSRGEL